MVTAGVSEAAVAAVVAVVAAEVTETAAATALSTGSYRLRCSACRSSLSPWARCHQRMPDLAVAENAAAVAAYCLAADATVLPGCRIWSPVAAAAAAAAVPDAPGASANDAGAKFPPNA
ncbi:hypothetical protein Vretifemale_16932 [Volvox reticuliferus]|nr:hypothetical protein Vretifemale_16932 [Volvox reticuliferus]